uniref:Uncharacterized protein n=2 Tax=Timema TaxID=61471 RepID=A0A7R9IRX0_9NEOP|nr:unnamed protein product [Timema bartmani]CAD7463374.1 unnamed protein product [Timema tahoe]
MTRRVRNLDPFPSIDKEVQGTYVSPFKEPHVTDKKGGKYPPNLKKKADEGENIRKILGSEQKSWQDGLSPWERVARHHTLSSARHIAYLKRTLEPKDHLDFVLQAATEHDKEVFPNNVDTCLQPETLGVNTWRTLRNTKVVPATTSNKFGQPLVIGGVKERRSIHNVELAVPTNHDYRSSTGYSRKENGSFYSHI